MCHQTYSKLCDQLFSTHFMYHNETNYRYKRISITINLREKPNIHCFLCRTWKNSEIALSFFFLQISYRYFRCRLSSRRKWRKRLRSALQSWKNGGSRTWRRRREIFSSKQNLKRILWGSNLMRREPPSRKGSSSKTVVALFIHSFIHSLILHGYNFLQNNKNISGPCSGFQCLVLNNIMVSISNL